MEFMYWIRRYRLQPKLGNPNRMNRSVMALMSLLFVLLSGCATLSGSDAPNVRVVGLEPLPNEGLEVRFALKLRVQNPNESALVYDGMSVNLDLDGRGLASGVSNVSGEIPRFSEAVLTVPVSISAFSVLRQLLGRAGDMQGEGSSLGKPIVYSLKGKLGATNGSSGATRFSDRGELNLFASEDETQ